MTLQIFYALWVLLSGLFVGLIYQKNDDFKNNFLILKVFFLYILLVSIGFYITISLKSFLILK